MQHSAEREEIDMTAFDLDLKRLSTYVDQMPAILLVYGADHKVIYANTKLLEFSDLTWEDIADVTLDELIQKGYFTDSASEIVFQKKQRQVRYVGGKMLEDRLCISTPILDELGEIRYVISLSLLVSQVESLSAVLGEAMLRTQQMDYLARTMLGENNIVAESKAMKEILTSLQYVSEMDSTVLLMGETGSGKEVLARFIHENSSRRDKIFLPLNCGAIPENLVESELFGYEPGAFTGAGKNGKPGVFELADGGTLFLDEIGEMPLLMQSRLLRVLENGEVTRIGSGKPVKVDVRIVTATNRDLKQMCTDGEFRWDLYYRLNIISAQIPPLRERKEDIIPLAEHFLHIFNKKYRATKVIPQQTMNRLRDYSWPGNVRELRNIIERMFMTSKTDFLMPADLIREDIAVASPDQPAAVLADFGLQDGQTLKERMNDYEKQIILHELKKNEGNVAKTAEVLGIHKTGLYKKLDKYNFRKVLVTHE